MWRWRRFWLRLDRFLRPGRAERELAREVEAHLSLIEEDFRRRGLPADEARAAARRAFGGVEQAKECQRDERSFVWLEALRQDVRHAARSLARSPGFALVVVLTLALGIGADTAIFSVVNAVLLRPLPYADADRLVRLVEQVPGSETRDGQPQRRVVFTGADLDALQDSRTLSQTAGYGLSVLIMRAPDEAVRFMAAAVSPAVFGTLGVRPLAGRLFEPQDGAPGADQVVVIGYDLWQAHFGGDPRVIGQPVSLQPLLGASRPNQAYTIVGVMPPAFHFPDGRTRAWIPSRFGAAQRAFAIARLAKGASIDAAEAEAGSILSRARGRDPQKSDAAPPVRVTLVRLQDDLVAPVRPALIVLAVAAACVLLIACANVASLLLARTAGRQREIAVRLALGAGRGRVIRHLLAESVMLSLAGGLAGTVLAIGGVELLRTLAAALSRIDLGGGVSLPRLDEVGVDGAALLFAVATSIVAGLLVGVGSALRASRPARMNALRESRAATGPGLLRVRPRGARGSLVAAQIVLATTLLVDAGLLVHSFVALAAVDLGYDPSNVLTFQVATPGDLYPDARVQAFAERLVARLRGIPGVAAAGFARQLPLVQLVDSLPLRTAPAAPAAPSASPPDIRLVSRDYLKTMGVRVIDGRGFGDGDGPGRPRVLLVNETLAHRDFAGEEPVGQSVYLGSDAEPWQIAGIVDDVREFGLDRPPEPQIFIDFRQASALGLPPFPLGPYFVVRTSGHPATLVADVRRLVRDLDAQARALNVAPMDRIVAATIARPHMYAVLVAIFAAVAVTLAAIGIFALLAYAVAQRTREIGIRLALGARRGRVVALVLSQSLIMTAIGVGAGLAAATVGARSLASLLYGLTPLDPATYFLAAVLFAVVAAVASWVPARRAAKIDPVVALRCE